MKAEQIENADIILEYGGSLLCHVNLLVTRCDAEFQYAQ